MSRRKQSRSCCTGVRLLGLCVLWLTCSGSPLGGLEVPFLNSRVSDLADMLTEPEEAQMEAFLQQLEKDTGAQVAMLTIPSLEGDSLELFSIRVVETWQLGEKEADNGTLFLVSRDDRLLRIEVGSGLEPVLTDALCGRILDRAVTPRFRAGDFSGGLRAGVEAIDEAIRTGDVRSLPSQPARKQDFAENLISVLVWSGFAMFFPGPVGVLLIFLVTPLIFFMGFSSWGLLGGCLASLLWLGIAFGLRAVIGAARGGSGPPGRSGRGGRWSSNGGFSGGFSGGGFSGGGFSGGGGSFGGGGASSGW